MVEARDANGWIVDLRGNGGGNTSSATVALGPLLGEGTLGFFQSKECRLSSDGVFRSLQPCRFRWFYQDTAVGEQPIDSQGQTYDPIIHQRIRGPRLVLADMPVAVWFNNTTAGSGEQIAIAFAGRKKERSFNLPTKGYAACCARCKLSDGAFLDMELGVAEDRRGDLYPEGAKPDVRVETDPSVGPDSDPVIVAAKAWLSGTVQ